ncbi:TPA: AAA family ATPase, partial [Listeria monocytogenes]|nr:AAA family ATPase [Listeria monocytogenes]
MRLTRLKITDLHSSYSYDIEFNKDITFFYGTNGSGKTTILNILSSIVTGKIYQLFTYEFSSITLHYCFERTKNKEQKIEILRTTPLCIEVTFNGQRYILEKFNESLSNYRQSINRNLEKDFFGENKFLKEIADMFNYVYLPLNRHISLDNNMLYDNRLHRERTINAMMHGVEEDENDYYMERDKSMKKVQYLIKTKVMRNNTRINRLNDNFRNQILRSSIDIHKLTFSIEEIFNEVKNLKVEEIKDIKTSYINILKNLNQITQIEEKNYVNFFDNYIREIKENENIEDNSVSIQLILKYNEIAKIKNIVKLAEDMETKKAKVVESVNLFCETINSFISTDGTEKKEILIDENGGIYLQNVIEKKQLSIYKLSSGEKQIVIFYANLIFGVNENKRGIFIVD